MRYARTLGMVFLGVAVSGSWLQGQDGQRYREYQLGADVATISALTRVEATEVKDIHVRPALIQELQWRRGYSTAAQADSVHQIAFSFYNDQLTKLVVDYDRVRTEGLTETDMTEALSMSYGAPSKIVLGPAARATASQAEMESGTPLARWGDADTRSPCTGRPTRRDFASS